MLPKSGASRAIPGAIVTIVGRIDILDKLHLASANTVASPQLVGIQAIEGFHSHLNVKNIAARTTSAM